MASIEEFIRKFDLSKDQYGFIEELETLCKEKLNSKNIKFLWESRVKDASSLKEKLQKRAMTNESDIQNIHDIQVLVDRRILLTRWRDIELVKETLDESFYITVQTQHPREAQNVSLRKSRSQGYNALHFYLTWRFPKNDQYKCFVIKIQVMSLMIYAWSQLEHDFEYKQLSRELSENVHLILEAITGLANVQGLLLQVFEGLLDSNPESPRLPQHAASFLANLICANKESIQSQLQRQAELERICLPVFRTSDYEMHKARNPDRMKETCQWTLQHPLFIDWRDSQNSNLIWVSANPGCGKSVLAKSLIDEELQSTQSRTTCYFFFKDDNADQKSVTFALSALLHQLFSQKRGLIKHALHQFKINGSKLPQLFDSQWEVLTKATADPEAGEVICILDAIDECRDSEQETLIAALKRFYHGIVSNNKPVLNDKPGPSLKFLVTSRPYCHVGHRFKDLALIIPNIRLAGEHQSELISQEIDLIIKERVRNLEVRETLESPLERWLLKTKHRTYLWVRLVFDVIENSFAGTWNGFHEIIRKLPDTVNNAYTAILERSEDKWLARKLLHIVVAAVRPLTMKEMSVALAIGDGNKSYKTLRIEPHFWFSTTVKKLYGHFVSEIDSRLYLAHRTAKEFLMSEESHIELPNHAVLGNWKQSLVPRESNSILAKACIWYLLSDAFENHPSVSNNSHEYINAHNFLEYAAEHWATHFQKAEVENMIVDELVTLRICDTRSGQFSPKDRRSFDVTSTDLMIGSHFDLKRTVQRLLKNGVDIEAKNYYGDTALHFAATNGKSDVVQLLLKSGAQIEATNGSGATALHHAAMNGENDVVQLLLKNGAKIEAMNRSGATALHHAAGNGRHDIVQKLLKKGAQIKAIDCDKGTALHHPTRCGEADIVQLLLESGANIEATDCNGNTPMHHAVLGNTYLIVKSLLESGANLDALNKQGSSALYLAREIGAFEIMRLLIKKGADLENMDDGLETSWDSMALDGQSEDEELDPACSSMDD